MLEWKPNCNDDGTFSGTVELDAEFLEVPGCIGADRYTGHQPGAEPGSAGAGKGRVVGVEHCDLSTDRPAGRAKLILIEGEIPICWVKSSLSGCCKNILLIRPSTGEQPPPPSSFVPRAALRAPPVLAAPLCATPRAVACPRKRSPPSGPLQSPRKARIVQRLQGQMHAVVNVDLGQTWPAACG